MHPEGHHIRGRGSQNNPKNRFETLSYHCEEGLDEQSTTPRTQFLKDSTSSIITYNSSPDVGFEAGINVYRGCEHGCSYCFARPTHEYLGFSAGLDFESKILVKENAPELLRQELSSPKWKPQVLGMSGVTDCYQPIERRVPLTRRCLEVLVEARNPVVLITKNHLIKRDIDLLQELARFKAVAVNISITTLDDTLRRVMEPRTSSPQQRLDALNELNKNGIPAGVLVAPIIPGLTDHEIPSILKAAAEAGTRFARYVILRLPYGVAPLFEQWLTEHFPLKKEKVLQQIRTLRGGKMYDSRYGTRMTGEGIFAKQIENLFRVSCKRVGIPEDTIELSTASFRRPDNHQLLLNL
jgi:DNA repair photolyase